MPEWIPMRSSARGRLVLAALDRFAASAYDDVGVGELAAAAGVTTGSLYHHFGNKLGLYDTVRADVERRVVDRLEGAVAARPDDPPGDAAIAALLVAFDFLTHDRLVRFLAVTHPDRHDDPVVRYIGTLCDRDGRPISAIIVAAWRAALSAALDVTDARCARAAFGALRITEGCTRTH